MKTPQIIDIKAGKLTYGQRIDLGRIFQDETNEAVKFEKVIQCLYGIAIEIKDYKTYLAHYESAVEGILFWLEREKELLEYKPSQEQVDAGIEELSKKIGEFGTISSLAKNFSKDPDEILNWEYGKVFGILYTDLQSHLFNQRYQKVIDNKYNKSRA